MVMRSLTTTEAVDPLEHIPFETRRGADQSPWLFTNMVTSMDGAAAVDGLSGPMGDPDDRAMFRALRASADAIIVGASTVNAERYRRPQRSDAVDAAREASGRRPVPLIAVVSASLSLDPTLDLFADDTYRPIVFTTPNADSDRRAALADRADIIDLGDTQGAGPGVDLAEALTHLGQLGHRTVLSEGGPTLNGQLIQRGLIDEWNLTVSPMLVGGSAPRTAHQTNAPPADALQQYQLTRTWQGDHSLFLRWVRSGHDQVAR